MRQEDLVLNIPLYQNNQSLYEKAEYLPYQQVFLVNDVCTKDAVEIRLCFFVYDEENITFIIQC